MCFWGASRQGVRGPRSLGESPGLPSGCQGQLGEHGGRGGTAPSVCWLMGGGDPPGRTRPAAPDGRGCCGRSRAPTPWLDPRRGAAAAPWPGSGTHGIPARSARRARAVRRARHAAPWGLDAAAHAPPASDRSAGPPGATRPAARVSEGRTASPCSRELAVGAGSPERRGARAHPGRGEG